MRVARICSRFLQVVDFCMAGSRRKKAIILAERAGAGARSPAGKSAVSGRSAQAELDPVKQMGVFAEMRNLAGKDAVAATFANGV